MGEPKRKRIRRSPAQLVEDARLYAEFEKLYPELLKVKGKRRTPEQIELAKQAWQSFMEAQSKRKVPPVEYTVEVKTPVYWEQCPDGTPHSFQNVDMLTIGESASRSRVCSVCGYSEWSEIPIKQYQEYLKGAKWPEPEKRPVIK